MTTWMPTCMDAYWSARACTSSVRGASERASRDIHIQICHNIKTSDWRMITIISWRRPEIDVEASSTPTTQLNPASPGQAHLLLATAASPCVATGHTLLCHNRFLILWQAGNDMSGRLTPWIGGLLPSRHPQTVFFVPLEGASQPRLGRPVKEGEHTTFKIIPSWLYCNRSKSTNLSVACVSVVETVLCSQPK